MQRDATSISTRRSTVAAAGKAIRLWRKVLLLVCYGSTCLAAESDTRILLHDVSDESGVQFQHTDGSQGGYHIVETTSAGLALLDYDLDGDLDIYFLNGAPMPGVDGKAPATIDPPPANALYRNDGNWQFTNVTEAAGVGDQGHGLGVAAGDYDNDGDADLYLNNFGPNVLYQNNGDGTFTDATRLAGVENGNRVGAGVSFLDIDADGDLDLYVANYVKYSFEKHLIRTRQGFPMYKGPPDYLPDPDALFRNNGDGTFTDISVESGIAERAAYGMGIVCADYDRDGDVDIFVGNDTGANYLFQNDGSGKFDDVALLQGFAYDGSGAMQGTMGVDCADIDNDGLLDIHVTSYQTEYATLYRNEGGVLSDVTMRSGAGLGTIVPVTWGNGLVDLDNDGDLDVVILNSRREPTLLRNDSATDHHWIDLRLRSDRSNGQAVGARVEVVTGELVQVDEVRSGRGYQSDFGRQLHFGLAGRPQVDEIRVHWPAGSDGTREVDVLKDVAADRVLTIEQ